MNINDIHKVELEITSNCNAACPGCARTDADSKGMLRVTDFSLADLQRMFPPEHCAKEFKFCGVLGDPAIHPEFVPMMEYLLENKAKIGISTNGAVGTADMWKRIGELTYQYENKVTTWFCIDGHKETNHIYRVNTKWNVLERNLNAFHAAAKEQVHKATWVFIVFDHNEHELEIAKDHAHRLGMKFATRTGMRNSYHTWIAQLGKKNDKVKKEITTTGTKEHSKKEQVEKLDNFIAKEDKTQEETSQILQTIKCKLIHEGEIFISAEQTMWPCCFLSDSSVKNKEGILDKLAEYGSDWNDLRVHSIDEILAHPWFDKILAESWDPNHNKHLTRCIRTCAYNKAYHNEVKVEA